MGNEVNSPTVETTAQEQIDPYMSEVFGLEPTQSAQEPTQPAQEPTGVPAGEQGVPDDLPGIDAQQAQQEAEERHRQAAARRAREEAARAQAEREKIDKVYADLFAGQTNPYTGKPILGKKDYDDYLQQVQAGKQEEMLQKAGIDKSVLEQLVDARVANHPDVVAARQEKQRAETERAEKLRVEAEKAVQEGVEKIHAMDDSINTVEDLYNAPYKDAFLGYLQKGLSMEDAFYLANREGMQKKNAAAARQEAINQQRSKAGMTTDAGGGGTGSAVPPEMAERFRDFMPDATDAEIEKAWRSYQKQLN